MNMDTILFNDISVGQVIPWLVALVALIAIARLFRTFFRKKKVNLQHTVYFVCDNCAWEGHISKFGTRCPKCDAPTGNLNDGPS